MSDLDSMARSLANLPRMLEEAAPKVAEAFDRELKASLAAGQAPDGTPWKPTKGGKQPLRGAAAHVATRAVGATVVSTLSGHDVFHNFGTGGGVPQRRILPHGGIPPRLAAAMRQELDAEFKRRTT